MTPTEMDYITRRVLEDAPDMEPVERVSGSCVTRHAAIDLYWVRIAVKGDLFRWTDIALWPEYDHRDVVQKIHSGIRKLRGPK